MKSEPFISTEIKKNKSSLLSNAEDLAHIYLLTQFTPKSRTHLPPYLSWLQKIIAFFYDPWNKTDVSWLKNTLENPTKENIDEIQYINIFKEKKDNQLSLISTSHFSDLKFKRNDVSSYLSKDKQQIESAIQQSIRSNEHIIIKVYSDINTLTTINISPSAQGINIAVFSDHIQDRTHSFQYKFPESLDLEEYLTENNLVTIETYSKQKSFLFRLIDILKSSISSIISFFRKEKKHIPFNTDTIPVDRRIAPNNTLDNSSEFEKTDLVGKTIYQAIIDDDLVLFKKVYNSELTYEDGLIEDAISYNMKQNSSTSQRVSKYILRSNNELDKTTINPSTGLTLQEQISPKSLNSDHKKQYSNAFARLNKLPPSERRNQGKIIQKCNDFLKEKNLDFSLNEEGMCSGLGFLYAYSKWLSHYLDDLKHRKDNQQYDDHSWFSSMIHYALNRDTQKSEEQDSELLRFIELITYYQIDRENINAYTNVKDDWNFSYKYQTKFGRFFESSNEKEKISPLFNALPVISTKELSHYLKILPEHHFIRLGSGGHTISLYKEKGSYFYYDSNSFVGERTYLVKDLYKLSQQIFSDFDYNPHSSQAIGINLYSFDSDQSEPSYDLSKLERMLEKNISKKIPYKQLFGLLLNSYYKYPGSFQTYENIYNGLNQDEQKVLSRAIKKATEEEPHAQWRPIADELGIELAPPTEETTPSSTLKPN